MTKEKKESKNALPEKLHGEALLARVKALQSKKKQPTIKEMARSCGYLYPDTGTEQVAEFQRELLIASGVLALPSRKQEEAPEPLKVGALYKIYNAKQFLAELGLKDGDAIEYRIRKTRNGKVAELTPVPRAPRTTATDSIAPIESISEVDLELTGRSNPGAELVAS